MCGNDVLVKWVHIIHPVRVFACSAFSFIEENGVCHLMENKKTTLNNTKGNRHNQNLLMQVSINLFLENTQNVAGGQRYESGSGLNVY